MNEYSVLMTMYCKDNPEYVKMSIDSMLKQTVLTNDFVVVCDGPLTSELDNLLNEYTKTISFFNVIRLEKNVGLGAALELGLKQCKNELVARMDDDDIALDIRCEKELEKFNENPNLDICGAYMNEFEKDIDSELRLKKVPLTQSDILAYSKRRNPFNHSTVMFKKSSIMKVGNYKPLRTNQDVELWVRGLNNGLNGCNIDIPLVYFRFDSSTYKRRKNKKNIKLMISLWKDFYKQGYCKYSDYFNVKMKQIIVYLMPVFMIKWAYNHLR